MSKRYSSGAASSSSSSKRRPKFTRQGTQIVMSGGIPITGVPAPAWVSTSGVRSYGRSNRSLGSETKYFDTSFDASITAAGTTWADTEVPCDFYVNASGAPAAYTDSCLIPTAQGSGYGQVDGQRYLLKKIRVRGSLQPATLPDQADSNAGGIVRIMLVMDTQPNGAQAQGEDIMQDAGDAPANQFSFMRVATTSGRFRILKDEIVVCAPTSFNDAAATGSTSYTYQTFSFQYQPKEPLQVSVANGNATPTVAGTIGCNIFLLCYGVVNGGATVGPLATRVIGCSRAYYVD